jgi:hypothetical protein
MLTALRLCVLLDAGYTRRAIMDMGDEYAPLADLELGR